MHYLPHQLATRVRSYFKGVAQELILSQDRQILSAMSPELHQDVRLSCWLHAMRERLDMCDETLPPFRIHGQQYSRKNTVLLSSQVLLYLYKDVLQAMPFFASKPLGFLLEVVHVIRHVVFPPQEFVVTEGDRSSCMYFVVSGAFAAIRARSLEVFLSVLLSARMQRLAADGQPSIKRWPQQHRVRIAVNAQSPLLQRLASLATDACNPVCDPCPRQSLAGCMHPGQRKRRLVCRAAHEPVRCGRIHSGRCVQ